METSDPSNQVSRHAQTLIPDPAAIIVPRQHGEVLIEPPAQQLAAFLAAARSGTKHSTQLATAAIDTLAQLARRELMVAMTRFAGETGFHPPSEDALMQPWIITGHQVELYHPGVWSKVILTDSLAKQRHGLAIDLLVDHDTVDHLGCAVPQWIGADLQKKMITWAEASALPAEFLSSPRHDEKTRWLSELQQFPLIQTDSLKEFTHYWQEDSDSRYISWMSRSRRSFERSFGMDVQHVPCSYICSGRAWHSFVLLWLREARNWCNTYNSALDEYRVRQEITNPGRPMPNLAITEKELELPFWIYGHRQPRQRLVLQTNSGPRLMCGDRHIDVTDLLSGDLLAAAEELRRRLESVNLRVRPRAMTLTMFVRLLLSDLFIHGIGGALYDQMTDQIMYKLFGVCPAYACASAGWLLPVAGHIDQSAGNLSHLKWRENHLRCNPEQLVPQNELTAAAKDLLHQRRDLISAINQSLITDRQEHRRRGPHWLRRRADFRRLHEINTLLLQRFGPQVDKLKSQMNHAELTQRNLSAARWREYFLAFHPRASLQQLITVIQSRVK
jgi:hypothetical protein